MYLESLQQHQFLSDNMPACYHFYKIYATRETVCIPDYRMIASIHIAIYQARNLSTPQVIDR